MGVGAVNSALDGRSSKAAPSQYESSGQLTDETAHGHRTDQARHAVVL
ncbi:hypothetical protein NOR53_1933 [gamma proteobacterium NOR5-3]|nr:hypothetical protein NOR53_1933 [gamma proteobacterium NOR5-3]